MQEAAKLHTASAAEVGSDRTRRRLPGDPGMWVFVLGDLFIFLAYFTIFMIYRSKHTALFLSSQGHLSLLSVLANTLVLLASSRFVALAVQSARANQIPRARRLVAGGAVCGLVFVGIKLYEWATLISGGYTLARNEYFMFYFTLTGVHLFHVLLGLVVLGVVTLELRRPQALRANVIEAGAIYWHMVDLLWVVLFALLYVMR